MLIVIQFVKLLLDLLDDFFVFLERLEVRYERCHSLVVRLLFLHVRHLNIERNGQVVEHIFLAEVAELLHLVQ